MSLKFLVVSFGEYSSGENHQGQCTKCDKQMEDNLLINKICMGSTKDIKVDFIAVEQHKSHLSNLITHLMLKLPSSI